MGTPNTVDFTDGTRSSNSVMVPSNLLFIHNPKAAGTSIRWLLGKIPVEKGAKRYRVPSHVPHSVLQRRLAESLQNGHSLLNLGFLGDKDALGGMSRPNWAPSSDRDTVPFGVVRNPYDRMWSTYKFFYKKKKKRPKRDRNAHDMVRAITQEEFFQPNLLKALGALLPHVRPQTYVFDLPDIRLLRFENLNEGWDKLMEDTGRDLGKLPKKQVSRGEPWQEGLSTESKANIREFYAKDFERFGY